MQESHSIEIRKVNDVVLSKLNCINQKTQNYIREVVYLAHKKIGFKNILSVILFGSQAWNNHASNECTVISDCDLMIIFKDKVPNYLIKRMERFIIALEKKHYARGNNSEFVNKMIDLVHQTTGMFVSHFLTKKSYFEQELFHKIFSVNKILSFLFAPKKLVLSSVVDNSLVLWGEDLRIFIKKKIDIVSTDMFKSLIMNFTILIASILLTPLKIFDVKYQLETIKWSLRASNYYAFEDSKPLKTVIKRYIAIEKKVRFRNHAIKFYSRFLNLRENPRNDLYFMLRCPSRIIKIHIKGILFRKMMIKKYKTMKLVKKN